MTSTRQQGHQQVSASHATSEIVATHVCVQCCCWAAMVAAGRVRNAHQHPRAEEEMAATGGGKRAKRSVQGAGAMEDGEGGLLMWWGRELLRVQSAGF